MVINKYRANKAAVRPAVLDKNEIRFFSQSLLSSTEQVAFFLMHLRQLDNIKPAVLLKPWMTVWYDLQVFLEVM